MTKDAHFSVDTRLARLLGETYRSSEVALKELVDNAWDADAQNVRITLPDPLSTQTIVVRDDGTGMTAQEMRRESRSRKSAQDDKWSFCLTKGTLCPRIRRDHEQKTPPEPHTGLQG